MSSLDVLIGTLLINGLALVVRLSVPLEILAMFILSNMIGYQISHCKVWSIGAFGRFLDLYVELADPKNVVKILT